MLSKELSGCFRMMILYTNDVPKVTRILNHTKKWLFKDITDDLKGGSIFNIEKRYPNIITRRTGRGKKIHTFTEHVGKDILIKN